MDMNVRLAKMTKAMKTQLFIDNLTTIFNPVTALTGIVYRLSRRQVRVLR